MRIAVYGSGGVGGYFGSRLASSGEDVIFIARGAHLEAMRENGLQIKSILGDLLIHPVHATDTPENAGTVDVVLVAVKSWQVPEIADSIKSMLGPDTSVIPLCNGIDAPQQLADVLGKQHILGGLCLIVSFVSSPGVIQHVAVTKPHITFGDIERKSSRRYERILSTFENAGVSAEISDDIIAAMWRKYIFITSISGVGAVTRVPVGTFRQVPHSRRLLQATLQEIYNISIVKQIRLPENIVDQTMSFIDKVDPEVIPSMQRDIMAGKPSELDAQTGTAVRLGKVTGIPTPVNSFIYSVLQPQELTARSLL